MGQDTQALQQTSALRSSTLRAERLTLHERDARAYVPAGDYDLVICAGAACVFGGFPETLKLTGAHLLRATIHLRFLGA